MDRATFDARVARLEVVARERPEAYRWLLVALALLGYAYLFLMLAVVGGGSLLLLLLIVKGGGILAAKLAIPGLALAAVVARDVGEVRPAQWPRAAPA